jgi:hypothetical protein
MGRRSMDHSRGRRRGMQLSMGRRTARDGRRAQRRRRRRRRIWLQRGKAQDRRTGMEHRSRA